MKKINEKTKKIFLKGSLDKDLSEAIELSISAYTENKKNILKDSGKGILTENEAVSKNRVISNLQLSIGSLVGAIIKLEDKLKGGKRK